MLERVNDHSDRRPEPSAARDGVLQAQAVVFDIDGLLLDTEALAMRALAEAGAVMGVEAPLTMCHDMIGVPADHCRILVLEQFGPGFPAAEFLGEASRRMEVLVQSGLLKLKPGVLELLRDMDKAGLRRAIATSSSRSKALGHLQQAGILSRFEAVVTRDDVQRGKPHPDLFLAAAACLDVAPGACVAFEDSYNGVRAAEAAGMTVVMVPDILPPTPEMQRRCAAIIESLGAVRIRTAPSGQSRSFLLEIENSTDRKSTERD